MSLDKELGVPVMQKPGVKKAMEAMNARLRRSTPVKNPLQGLSYDGYLAHHYAYRASVEQSIEPTCFDEAVGNDEWEKAMDEEMVALYGNDTWDLSTLPKDKKTIGNKWVYKVKHNSDGSISMYKAKLVAKGYAQTHGIDYEKTFAPVAKMATIHSVIAVDIAKG